MRTRLTEPITTHTTVLLPVGSPTPIIYDSQLSLLYEEIADEQHGWGRNNAVTHGFAKLDVSKYDYDDTQGYHSGDFVYNRSARQQHSIISSFVTEAVNSVVRSFQNTIVNEVATAYKRIGTINFLLELADAKSLAKGIEKWPVKLREAERLRKAAREAQNAYQAKLYHYRFLDKSKEARASLDESAKSLRDTNYLEYEFGLAPFLRDIVEMFNRVDVASDAMNAKLDSMRRFSKVSKTKTIFITIPELNSSLDDWYTYTAPVKVTVRMKGTVNCILPRLTKFDRDWYLWLDKIGFHPDLATIWEAIPFSWLVDWAAPIGPTLESFSGSWFRPICYFSGNISYKASLTSDILQRRLPSNSFFNGKKVGFISYRDYRRLPYGSEFSGRSLISFETRIPLLDPRRVAIGASIVDIPSSWKRRVTRIAKIRPLKPKRAK